VASVPVWHLLATVLVSTSACVTLSDLTLAQVS